MLSRGDRRLGAEDFDRRDPRERVRGRAVVEEVHGHLHPDVRFEMPCVRSSVWFFMRCDRAL